MDPNRSNSRGGFPPGFPPGFPLGYEDRTPTPASSFASAQARGNRQTQRHGYFISRAQSSGIHVASPAYGEGVRRNAGFGDPNKTPTQGPVFPSMGDQNKTPTQALPYSQPQGNSSSGGDNYNKAREELGMLIHSVPNNQKVHFEAMTQQFLRDDYAVETNDPADKTALGGNNIALRSNEAYLGGHMTPFGGNTTAGNMTAMRGHELPTRSIEPALGGGLSAHGGNKPVFAVDMNAPGRGTAAPGRNTAAPNRNTAAPGSIKPVLGGNHPNLKDWLDDEDFDESQRAIVSGKAFAKPNKKSDLGGYKPDINEKWSAHKGYGMGPWVVGPATPFDPPQMPFTSSQANSGASTYGTLPYQSQTSPKLREAFKTASDRKKLGANQNKVISGNSQATTGRNKARSADKKVPSVFEKPSLGYKIPGIPHQQPTPAYGIPGISPKQTTPAYEKPESTQEKRGPAPQEASLSQVTPSATSSKAALSTASQARHHKMMEDLEKEAGNRTKVAHAHSDVFYDLSDAAFAKSDATWDASKAALNDTARLVDEAFDAIDACSRLGPDLKEDMTVHMERIEDLDKLVSRHANLRDEHLKCAKLHGDMADGVKDVSGLHKEALKAYQLLAHGDVALTTALDKIIHTNEDAARPGDAVSRSVTGHGATAQAPVAQAPTAQAAIVRRDPFQGLFMPSSAEAAVQYAAQGAFQAAAQGASQAAAQGSAVGSHVGNTTNRPTRPHQQHQQQPTGQAKEQAFASRAAAHGIRLRSAGVDDEKDKVKKA